MYCLKPPMTQPPEGTAATSRSGSSVLCMFLYGGYIWRGVREEDKGILSRSLSLCVRRELELSLVSGPAKRQSLGLRRSVTRPPCLLKTHTHFYPDVKKIKKLNPTHRLRAVFLQQYATVSLQI